MHKESSAGIELCFVIPTSVPNMAAAPVVSAAAAAADSEDDPIWTDLVDWLARFPGGTGVEEKVRLIHNQGVHVFRL